MSHTSNMYGSNLKEYAQNVIDNKQIAVSTRAEWNMLIKRLPLEDFTYPPVFPKRRFLLLMSFSFELC